ncbi:MAG: hypothetical protein QM520_05040, partial [Gammaproteobacteria bacterium]|nr:hypothetical protein [Gammaproteobacteria bacterium]
SDRCRFRASKHSLLTALLGSYSYEVLQVDVAGNSGSISSPLGVNYVNSEPLFNFQLLPISDTGTSMWDGITSHSTIQVVGLSSGNNSWKYKMDTDSWQTGVGSTFIASLGSHNYQVYQVDSSSNTTTSTHTLKMVLDNVAPSSLTILVNDSGSSSTDGITNQASLAITGLETGASWQYRIDGDPRPWIEGTDSSFSALLGHHVYEVRQRDTAGNTSAITRVGIDYDTTPPSAPKLSFLDLGGGLTHNNQITIASEAKAQVQVQVDNNGLWSNIGTAGSEVFFTAFNNQFSVGVSLDQDGLLRINDLVITLNSGPGTALSTFYRLIQLQALFGVGGQAYAKVNGKELPIYSEDSIYDILRTETVDLTYLAQAGSHSYQFRQVDAAGNISDITSKTIQYTQASLPMAETDSVLEPLWKYPVVL